MADPTTPVTTVPSHCEHHDCRCARAAELAAMGMTAEAVEVHYRRVPCRRTKPATAADLRRRLERQGRDIITGEPEQP